MARRGRRSRQGIQLATEIALGTFILVGIGTYYGLGWGRDESFQAALVGAAVVFGIWLVRPLLTWLARKRPHLRRSRGRWWARRTTGGGVAFVAAVVGAAVARYEWEWEAWPSVEVGLLVGLVVFALWLVKPMLGWLSGLAGDVGTWATQQAQQQLGAIGREWVKRRPRLQRGGRGHTGPRYRTTRRSQLQRLSPDAFEELCAQIARQWGYQSRVSGESGDGGIDVEMWRDGEYVVGQCKRYKNTVPIAHVRDFYGAMMHVGAVRGYFFTTSRFSDGAYEFIQGKPIALIDGEYIGRILARVQQGEPVTEPEPLAGQSGG